MHEIPAKRVRQNSSSEERRLLRYREIDSPRVLLELLKTSSFNNTVNIRILSNLGINSVSEKFINY